MSFEAYAIRLKSARVDELHVNNQVIPSVFADGINGQTMVLVGEVRNGLEEIVFLKHGIPASAVELGVKDETVDIGALSKNGEIITNHRRQGIWVNVDAIVMGN